MNGIRGAAVVCVVVLGMLAGAGPALAPPAGGPVTTRVSVNSSGAQGNDFSGDPTMSADGRFVAFHSFAEDLVAGDTNGALDIFVHDRQTGETTRVSIADGTGGQGNGHSNSPAISADGRFVAFESLATNLVAVDANEDRDVFVHDRQTGQTTLVSVNSDGVQGDADSREPAISADGQFVAFDSFATNLVAFDNTGDLDVFVHDRQNPATTTRVSVDIGWTEGDGGSEKPAISADGRFVAFHSSATDLVEGDINGEDDIFVRDRATPETTRVSVDSNGVQGNADSNSPAINADGRFVAFQSVATNLVAGDANGVLDAFVHDRQTGETTIASVTSTGAQGNGNSGTAAISADGGSVGFHGSASNLVAGDTNGNSDVFVHDRQTGQTTRVSVDSSGAEGNAQSLFADISADGRFVAFRSNAFNLVAGDTNDTTDVFVHDRGEAFAALEVIANGPTRSAAGDRMIAAKVTNRGATPLTVSDADVDWPIRVGALACDGTGDLSEGPVVATNPGSTTLGPGKFTTFRYKWTYGPGEVSPGTGIEFRAVFTPFGWGDCEFQVAK